MALLGTSKGAEAALLTAVARRDVAAVVVYAPSSLVWSCVCADAQQSSWTSGGVPIAFVSPGRDPRYVPPAGFPIEPSAHYEYRMRTARPAAAIPVSAIAGPILLIAGGDDRLWPSEPMAKAIVKRRRARGDHLMIFRGQAT